MPCRFPGPHPGGKLRGLVGGGVVSRPTPKTEVEGSGLGDLQAYTQRGESPGPHPGGSPGPHPGGCIPACSEADPPMATAAGSTHPTGMHSQGCR